MSWDHILQPTTNLTNVLINWVDEPNSIVWALTAVAGLLWILVRRVVIGVPSGTPSTPPHHPRHTVGWWDRLRRCLPAWPRRPNLVLLVLSPSSSRSQLHDDTANPDEDKDNPHSANSPPSSEIVSFHFESNTSHCRSSRRRKAFSTVPLAEGVSSNSDGFLSSSVRFVPSADTSPS